MADSVVNITPGSGAGIDTRTNTGGEHRQVVVLGADGDPITTLNTAGTKIGLDVNLSGSASGVAVVSGTVTNAANQAVTASVANSGNATVSLIGGTWTGMPIIFEGSADGGTNWFTIDATQADGTGINSQLTLPGNSGPRNWNIMCPGYTHIRVRTTGTFATFTTSPTIYINQGPFLVDPSPTIAPIDGQKWTYTLAINPTNTAGIANALDQWNFGNPTGSGKTIRIIRLSFGVAIATTVVGTVSLVKRSAANTGGTQVAITRTPLDSGIGASISVGGGIYSAAPTAVGASVGFVRQTRLSIPAVTAAPALLEWTFGNRPGAAVVLRPGEYLGLTLGTLANAAVASAPTVNGDIEWTEE